MELWRREKRKKFVSWLLPISEREPPYLYGLPKKQYRFSVGVGFSLSQSSYDQLGSDDSLNDPHYLSRRRTFDMAIG